MNLNIEWEVEMRLISGILDEAIAHAEVRIRYGRDHRYTVWLYGGEGAEGDLIAEPREFRVPTSLITWGLPGTFLLELLSQELTFRMPTSASLHRSGTQHIEWHTVLQPGESISNIEMLVVAGGKKGLFGTLSYSRARLRISGEISLFPNSRKPEAADDYAETLVNTPVTISVLRNDHDPDGDPLYIVQADHGKYGEVEVHSGGLITYTPDRDWYGTDRFSYVIDDGHGFRDAAEVTVVVSPSNESTFDPDYYVEQLLRSKEDVMEQIEEGWEFAQQWYPFEESADAITLGELLLMLLPTPDEFERDLRKLPFLVGVIGCLAHPSPENLLNILIEALYERDPASFPLSAPFLQLDRDLQLGVIRALVNLYEIWYEEQGESR